MRTTRQMRWLVIVDPYTDWRKMSGLVLDMYKRGEVVYDAGGFGTPMYVHFFQPEEETVFSAMLQEMKVHHVFTQRDVFWPLPPTPAIIEEKLTRVG